MVVLLIYFAIAEKRKLSCPTRYDSSLSGYVAYRQNGDDEFKLLSNHRTAFLTTCKPQTSTPTAVTEFQIFGNYEPEKAEGLEGNSAFCTSPESAF